MKVQFTNLIPYQHPTLEVLEMEAFADLKVANGDL